MIVLIGDVGTPGGHYHLGDEAMLEAALHALRDRGLNEVTVISADPESTSKRYGTAAIARAGFGAMTPTEREARLDAIEATARGERNRLEHHDPARTVIETIAASDGVVITGGGNLSVFWPEHVYERAAIGLIAQTLGRPLVMSGQMLGPTLDRRSGELVGELLLSSAAVALRDEASLAIARSVVRGRRVAAVGDDALFLGAGALTDGDEEPENVIGVTISAHVAGMRPDAVADGAATLLDSLQQLTGLDVLFIPHEGTEGRLDDGDSAMHARIAERLGHGDLGALLPAADAARQHRTASFIVSTRYHPVVFASAAGRPMLAAASDDYTATKLRGALALVGQQEGLVPTAALGSSPSRAAASALWRERRTLHETARYRVLAARAAQMTWWDQVADLLMGRRRSTRGVPEPVLDQLDPIGFLSTAERSDLALLNHALIPLGSAVNLHRLRESDLDERLARIESELLDAQRQMADKAVEAAEARTALDDLERALSAAHDLQGRLADRAMRRALSRNVERYVPTSTLEGLLATRTFRWTRHLRRFLVTVRNAVRRR